MASDNFKVALGILAVIVALFIVVVALGIPTGFCSSVNGIQQTCTTDTTATIGVGVALIVAILLAGSGVRTAWKHW